MMKSFQQIQSSLEDVIFEIQSSCLDGEWFISAERIMETLGMRKEEYYRYIYALKDQENYSDYSKGFNESAGNLLILFLSRVLKIEGIEHEFAKSGIYFQEEYLHNLAYMIRNTIQSKLEKHTLDKDLLLLLSTATKYFDDAFDAYFDDQFDIHRIIENCVSDFIEKREIDPSFGADTKLKGYMHSILHTKVFHLRDITEEYRDRAYYELFGRFREKQYRRPSQRKIDPEFAELLSFFGLAEDSTKEDLRRSYKELMKKYHPDVNKKGLEMTKTIISKYNQLVLRMS